MDSQPSPDIYLHRCVWLLNFINSRVLNLLVCLCLACVDFILCWCWFCKNPHLQDHLHPQKISEVTPENTYSSPWDGWHQNTYKNALPQWCSPYQLVLETNPINNILRKSSYERRGYRCGVTEAQSLRGYLWEGTFFSRKQTLHQLIFPLPSDGKFVLMSAF